MTFKKIIFSLLAVAMVCLAIFLSGCTKKDGDVGDNPDHSASNSPSAATIKPTSDHTEGPLESMIPDVLK